MECNRCVLESRPAPPMYSQCRNVVFSVKIQSHHVGKRYVNMLMVKTRNQHEICESRGVCGNVMNVLTVTEIRERSSICWYSRHSLKLYS